MLREDEIAAVIDAQQRTLTENTGLDRDMLSAIPVAESFATIITGLRRCGKSTLLRQLLRKYPDALYLHFEDIRLAGFTSSDFARLHRIVEKRAGKTIFFDEVQLVSGWEIYVSQLLREKYTVFVTGSNAAMLSVELGTHLTGRHISVELFPFSYAEFQRFCNLPGDSATVTRYMRTGGLPEYVKTGIPAILNTLIDDILWRDIAVRHAVRDINSLRQLAIYLLTNIANTVTASSLRDIFGVKAPSTLLEYFSWLRDAYLFDFVPAFSYSLKTQARNPKKVYVMDLGLYTENALTTSENLGHRMENLIFLHLRRQQRNIFYFRGQGECDFIIMEKGIAILAAQVCLRITDENFAREYNGLKEAMQTLGLKHGVIVTLEQRDLFHDNDMDIRLVPAAEFLAANVNQIS